MTVTVGNFTLGTGRTFVIAEIGNNHNGSYARAIEMIDMAADCGADCVKFQMRHLEEVYRQRALCGDAEDLGTEYVVELLRRFELTKEEHRQIAEYCREKKVLYLCTPWDERSIKVLEGFKVPAYKVASADLTNLPLLDKLCMTGKPLILSTGMSRREEIQITVDFLHARNAKFILLHCNSTYPAPFHDIQLKWMDSLRAMHPWVGYSGHERGVAVSHAAVALGACVIERHFTLDRNMEGPDHAASLKPEEFRQLVVGIREIEQALSGGTERYLSQGEMINRESLGKSLVAATHLRKGKILTPADIKVRSPGQGLSPQHYQELLGRTLQHDMAEEDFFFPSDVGDLYVEPRNYKFQRPWGIPVRYHDVHEYLRRIKPDFIEFHMSYLDMEIEMERYLTEKYSCGFVVHAPELFSGSHLLDLASADPVYRTRSIQETQRVINITRKLKNYFPKTSRPMIVVNVGGFTMDAPLRADEVHEHYERFAQSLRDLDTNGVEITPQTMAPFPWHFGGQRYQNMFVKIDEIEAWCNKLKVRMCFDVSHSRLTCNYFGINFYDFCGRMAPHTAHIHMGDARGVNGEGLQIGEGDIDFQRLGNILRQGCRDAPFIPEIWQGHKNGGEGFWVALGKLEGVL